LACEKGGGKKEITARLRRTRPIRGGGKRKKRSQRSVSISISRGAMGEVGCEARRREKKRGTHLVRSCALPRIRKGKKGGRKLGVPGTMAEGRSGGGKKKKKDPSLGTPFFLRDQGQGGKKKGGGRKASRGVRVLKKERNTPADPIRARIQRIGRRSVLERSWWGGGVWTPCQMESMKRKGTFPLNPVWLGEKKKKRGGKVHSAQLPNSSSFTLGKKTGDPSPTKREGGPPRPISFFRTEKR